MIKVLKQMVEALEWCHGGEPIGTAEAIKAGKKLIAELESQKRAVIDAQNMSSCTRWVGLTDDEQSFIYDQVKQIVDSKPFWVKFADSIEAKLKERNNA
jgi:hypothetical protein